MKRVCIVGMCVVSMVSFGAMASSEAQAAPTVWGWCVRVTPGKGTFGEKYCATPGGKLNFAFCPFSSWAPCGFHAPPYGPYTAKFKSVTFVAPGGEINCKKSASTETLFGEKEQQSTFTFTKCRSKYIDQPTITGGSCTTAGPKETIFTNTLEGYLIGEGEKGKLIVSGKHNQQPEPAGSEIWEQYYVQPGQPNPYFLEIRCEVYEAKKLVGEERLRVEGTVSARLCSPCAPPWDLNKRTTQLFKYGAGEQPLWAESSMNGGATWSEPFEFRMETDEEGKPLKAPLE